MNRTPTRSAIEAALAAYPRVDRPAVPGRRNDIHSGVLVPLVGESELSCVLTERPRTLRMHAGEICFPGGRPEAGDRDLEATARREAREEIGVSDVTIVGRLSSVPLLTSEHRLHPFVGFARESEIVPNRTEVARLVVYSLPELLGRSSIDAIAWDDRGMMELAPVFETGGRLLFGATAYVLFELLVALAPVFETTVPERVVGRYKWQDVLSGKPPAITS